MFDIKCIYVKGKAEVTYVELLSNDLVTSFFNNSIDITNLPVMLRVQGDNFDRAELVLVNGMPATHTLINKKELWLILPEELSEAQIESIDVVTNKFEFNSSAFYTYELGNSVDYVDGTTKLIMQFIKLLMTSKGTDLFEPSSGGNLQKWVGTQVTGDQKQSLIAKAALLILDTSDQIRLSQQGQALPPSERLNNVEIINASFDYKNPSVLLMDIRITAFNNVSQTLSLALGA